MSNNLHDNKSLAKADVFNKSPLMVLMPKMGDLSKLESLYNSFFARYESLKNEREKTSKLIDDGEEKMLRTLISWISGE
ncbi:MAG: hypothetical protein SPJ04_09080 [Bdellovibrionota bacterium]|nr:hypothetical protein [Pseudomonadota bacterium]MDY6091384.1 hypothetical protein [Bdellovibrionota bacterium]